VSSGSGRAARPSPAIRDPRRLPAATGPQQRSRQRTPKALKRAHTDVERRSPNRRPQDVKPTPIADGPCDELVPRRRTVRARLGRSARATEWSPRLADISRQAPSSAEYRP
jgi:hypothetical protein